MSAPKTPKCPEHLAQLNEWKLNYDQNPNEGEEYMGPTRLLKDNLCELGWQLDENLIIHKEQETDIDIVRMPCTHLKKAVNQMGQRSRTIERNKNRTYAGLLHETDT